MFGFDCIVVCGCLWFLFYFVDWWWVGLRCLELLLFCVVVEVGLHGVTCRFGCMVGGIG